MLIIMMIIIIVTDFFFQVYPIYHVVLYLEKCMLKDCVFEFMLLCYVLWNINIAKQHCEYKTAMWSIDKSWLLQDALA